MRFVVATSLLLAAAMGPFACSNDLDLAFTRDRSTGQNPDSATKADVGATPDSSSSGGCPFGCDDGSSYDAIDPDGGYGDGAYWDWDGMVGDGSIPADGAAADGNVFADAQRD